MRPATVLVVEDERIIALTIRRMLEARGYTVVGTASSAETAIQKARLTTPDIVLMDINLEGPVDGIEAARQIEADSGTAIVFLTAYTEDDTIRRASECHAYSYLVKPVQAAELHATLQIAIAKNAVDHQLRLSDHRLRLALDAASLAVWDWNSNADLVETTGDITKLLGPNVPPADTLTALFQKVLPEDRPAFNAFLAQATAFGPPANLAFRYQWADNSIHWIEAFASSYKELRTATCHTIGTLRNITAQRETESRLSQAAALFENLTDAVAIATHTCRISAVNPAFERITGYPTASAIGLDIQSILRIPPHGQPPWQGESQCSCDDGRELSIWLTITPVVTGDATTALVYSFSDLSPLRRAQADLDYLAHHDALTGLPNRLLFQEQIDQWIALGLPFSLYYVDLDHFKLINDSRGHNAGDLVLQAVANRIRALLGKFGFAARLGGDEFVIATQQHGLDFAESLVSAISLPIPVANEALVTTASVGTSEFPADGADRESLLLAADTAMYTAKREGPNCYRTYTPALSVPHAERYEIEQGIRRAFASSELQLLYQPTVSLATGKITGAEALVRWMHPERGLLNPDRFVPIAEDAGLIEQLGESVLRMACRDWAACRDGGAPIPRLSINVSARQITRGHFPGLLDSILREFRIPPASLEIEITESSLQSITRSRNFIRDCKEIGVNVSIDDFGTGYSHLAALRDLPVDRIKLDRGFLPTGQPQARDVALLNAIVGIARAMNLKITAEGIETITQLDFLRRIGCDEGQGFWFSHPTPFDRLLSLIRVRPFEGAE